MSDTNSVSSKSSANAEFDSNNFNNNLTLNLKALQSFVNNSETEVKDLKDIQENLIKNFKLFNDIKCKIDQSILKALTKEMKNSDKKKKTKEKKDTSNKGINKKRNIKEKFLDFFDKSEDEQLKKELTDSNNQLNKTDILKYVNSLCNKYKNDELLKSKVINEENKKTFNIVKGTELYDFFELIKLDLKENNQTDKIINNFEQLYYTDIMKINQIPLIIE